MRPTIARSIGVAFLAAFVACSQDGRAATDASAKAAQPAQSAGAPLFRDAAQTAPAPEAQVPVQVSLAPLIDKLKPAVVNISTTTVVKHPQVRGPSQKRQRSPHGGPQGGPQDDDEFQDFFDRFFGGRPGPEMPEEFHGSSLGSGFVISPDGFILTNNHVVKDATDIVVRLSDGSEYKAESVGRDPATDVALIRLAKPPKNLPTVVLGDSDAARQGDFVLAMGSPLGLRDTATLGIISAKHRQELGIGAGGTYDDFLQTDAAINPGNSGGPLFNLRGEVIGINTAIVSPQMGSGIGFAVPINIAKAILPQLREKGKVTRGYIGVSVGELTRDLAQGFKLPPDQKGALVQNVVPKGPAAKAGLEAGDIIVAVNGKPVESRGDVTRTVALIPPGQKAELTVLRKGAKKQFAFPVAQRPEEEAIARGELGGEQQGEQQQSGNQSPKLGVTVADMTPEIARQLGFEGPAQGVVVTEVADGGPAQRAGIRPGDVILELNQAPVKRSQDIAGEIKKLKEGDIALLRVRRGDQAIFVAVPVGGTR
ncbi:MAG TPA: Do family serine endopeptidase [Anaeromyxobacter sp.]|nr:Do family serine endopeptidase [Anaeromyxobacter sp.]